MATLPRVLVLSVVLVALLLGNLRHYQPASALTTLTVNSTGDLGDNNAGNGVCDTGGLINAAPECTLRAAIQEANALSNSLNGGGVDVINFNIAGCPSNACTIIVGTALGNPLPAITEPVVINGYSQTGAAVNTNPTNQNSNAVIHIHVCAAPCSGVNANQDGLVLDNAEQGNGSVIEGLEITNFTRGVRLNDSWLNKIAGNSIHNNNEGISLLCNGVGCYSNVIGAEFDADARNVIYTNANSGIFLTGTANNTVMAGNHIGINVAGVAAGNGGAGISISSGPAANAIGDGTDTGRNVISNNSYGVILSFAGNSNSVQGNFIGTDLAGTANMGNSPNVGVFIQTTNNALVGGVGEGLGNVIAFNPAGGVWVTGVSTGTVILENSIHDNHTVSSGLGIDLGGDQVTLNDNNDVDTGDNNLQNFPVITSVTFDGTQTDIAVTLNSIASTPFRIEAFANDACGFSNHGEGQTFLVGDDDVDTNAANNASHTLHVLGNWTTKFITTTATRQDQFISNIETSEFSACFAPTSQPTPTPTNTPTPTSTPTPGATSTPTRTPTPTNTPAGVATATPTRTSTPVVGGATSTPTSTQTVTPNSTVQPLATFPPTPIIVRVPTGSGVLAGVVSELGRPTPAPAVVAPALPVVPAVVISPPNTGDGGLR